MKIEIKKGDSIRYNHPNYPCEGIVANITAKGHLMIYVDGIKSKCLRHVSKCHIDDALVEKVGEIKLTEEDGQVKLL